MLGEREPLRWYHREDAYEGVLVGEELVVSYEFGFERFGWCFPERRCIPGPHAPSERVVVDTMENLFAEAELEAAGEEGTRP